MAQQSFSLIPFPAPGIPNMTITGTVARRRDILTLHYSLAGNTREIFLPPPSAQPCRKDELWKTTCFEFFLAVRDQPQYWEFNMSPSGDWNVYQIDAYRRIGFREEMSIRRLPIDLRVESNGYSLHVSANLPSAIQRGQSIDIGITAIIQTNDGNITYWALLHPAPQADFHLKESFICSL